MARRKIRGVRGHRGPFEDLDGVTCAFAKGPLRPGDVGTPSIMIDLDDIPALVEQVAKALRGCDNHPNAQPWNKLGPGLKSFFRDQARAVLRDLGVETTGCKKCNNSGEGRGK